MYQKLCVWLTSTLGRARHPEIRRLISFQSCDNFRRTISKAKATGGGERLAEQGLNTNSQPSSENGLLCNQRRASSLNGTRRVKRVVVVKSIGFRTAVPGLRRFKFDCEEHQLQADVRSIQVNWLFEERLLTLRQLCQKTLHCFRQLFVSTLHQKDGRNPLHNLYWVFTVTEAAIESTVTAQGEKAEAKENI